MNKAKFSLSTKLRYCAVQNNVDTPGWLFGDKGREAKMTNDAQRLTTEDIRARKGGEQETGDKQPGDHRMVSGRIK